MYTRDKFNFQSKISFYKTVKRQNSFPWVVLYPHKSPVAFGLQFGNGLPLPVVTFFKHPSLVYSPGIFPVVFYPYSSLIKLLWLIFFPRLSKVGYMLPPAVNKSTKQLHNQPWYISWLLSRIQFSKMKDEQKEHCFQIIHHLQTYYIYFYIRSVFMI